MRKILISVLVSFAALIPTAPVFADSVIHSNFGGYMYPIPVSVSNPWTITGTAGNYIMVYDVTTNNYFTYLGGQVPRTRTTAEPWNGGGRVGHTMALVASNVLSGPCTASSYTACRASPNWQGEERFIYGVAPPVLGCMDASALNYNAAADTDDGSCTYPPKIVGMVSDAEDGFASTTGFTLAAGVGWSADNLIKPWAGVGIGMFGELAKWLSAIAIIFGAIFFAYRALNSDRMYNEVQRYRYGMNGTQLRRAGLSRGEKKKRKK